MFQKIRLSMALAVLYMLNPAIALMQWRSICLRSCIYSIYGIKLAITFWTVFVATGASSQAGILRKFSDMPANSTTIFPSPSIRNEDLAQYGVSLDRWLNESSPGSGDGSWERSTPSAMSFFSDLFKSSQVAPFGRSAIHSGIRLTFVDPIYAFGATEIAIDPNKPGSSSLPINVGNTQYEMIAYDTAGEIMYRAFWSSYGNILGPVEYGTTFNGTGYMGSYLGVVSDVPIYQVTILGSRPSDGSLISATGSISFSTLAVQVPEPTSVAIWGIGAIGIGLFARRKKRHTASA